MVSRVRTKCSFRDLAGEPPRLSSSQDLMDAMPGTAQNRRHVPAVAPSQAKRDDGKLKPLRLAAVARAMEDAGMDPAREIAAILKHEIPQFDHDGNPIVDPTTGKQVTKPAVDSDTKLRTHLALLEYMQPKLRATEMKVSGTVDLTTEQIEARVNLLLAKTRKG